MPYEVNSGSIEEAQRCIDALRTLLDKEGSRWNAILAEGITPEDDQRLVTILNGLGAAQWVSKPTPEDSMQNVASIFRYAFCVGYQRGRGNRPVIKWRVAEEDDESTE